ALSQLAIHSNNIAYGYKKVYDKVADFGASGSCEINVLCPLGNGWDHERNAVALVLNDNESKWCSGCMVMNTCNANTPFFLTANHCLTGQDVSGWRFTFQAWSPTCTPSQNSSGVTFNGSVLRANYATSDFCLVELNSTPAINSGIYYAGWTRSTSAPSTTIGIHHPAGDVMKISRDINTATRGDYLSTTGTSHWIVNWDDGVTEGGSSGSPLFDPNHRIIGQLHGGYS
ncbi:MAG: serine protease, partial [Chitinophagales bacterium]|nr:serine protease [Chitinophagales bacterium]